MEIPGSQLTMTLSSLNGGIADCPSVPPQMSANLIPRYGQAVEVGEHRVLIRGFTDELRCPLNKQDHVIIAF